MARLTSISCTTARGYLPPSYGTEQEQAQP